MNTLNLSQAELEWSRTLMVAWLAIVLALSVIEVFWLTDGFSLRTLQKGLCPKTAT